MTAPRLAPAGLTDRAQMTVDCVESADGLRGLRDTWRNLLDASPGATPFNSWEWAFSWWKAYGRARPLKVLVFRDAEGVAGIAPLYLDHERIGSGLRARVLHVIGDGSFDSDYLGFIVRQGAEDAVLARWFAWLRQGRDWDAVALRAIAEQSALPGALCALAGAAGMPFTTDYSPCATLRLPGSFDAFLRERRSRFRTKLRALLRKVDDGQVTFVSECAPRELHGRLRSLFALHQARLRAAGSPGVFGAAPKRRFYAHFAVRFARAGWLRLYSLRLGEAYVAHELCFSRNGVTYLLQEGFDTTDAAASYGQTLRAAVVRHLIDRGETTYDFLGGASRHKDDWGATEGRLVHVIIGRNGWRGSLYVKLPSLRERAAVLAKRVLPARAIAALRRRPA